MELMYRNYEHYIITMMKNDKAENNFILLFF